MGRGTTVPSPFSMPFPLQNRLPLGWMPSGRGTSSHSPSSKCLSAWKQLAPSLGWKNHNFPAHPEFRRSLREFTTAQTGTLPWASSQNFCPGHLLQSRASTCSIPSLLPRTQLLADAQAVQGCSRCFLDVSSLGSLSHWAGKRREVPFDTTCPFQSHSFPLRWLKN